MDYIFHSKEQNGRRATVAGVYDNGQLSLGIAVCSPNDQFVKKHGRNIAVGRARSTAPLKSVTLPKAPNSKEFLALAREVSRIQIQKFN